jgi:hypothetical protein
MLLPNLKLSLSLYGSPVQSIKFVFLSILTQAANAKASQPETVFGPFKLMCDNNYYLLAATMTTSRLGTTTGY